MDKFATTLPPPPKSTNAGQVTLSNWIYAIWKVHRGDSPDCQLTFKFAFVEGWGGTLRVTLGELFCCAKPYVMIKRPETGCDQNQDSLFVVESIKRAKDE